MYREVTSIYRCEIKTKAAFDNNKKCWNQITSSTRNTKYYMCIYCGPFFPKFDAGWNETSKVLLVRVSRNRYHNICEFKTFSIKRRNFAEKSRPPYLHTHPPAHTPVVQGFFSTAYENEIQYLASTGSMDLFFKLDGEHHLNNRLMCVFSSGVSRLFN